MFRQFQQRPESDHADLNTKILLAAIVSLSFVLLLVFALHLYARFVLRRQARRRAAVHHLSLTVARAHYSLGEPPNNAGLDPTLIASLPIFVFERKKHKSQSGDNGEDEGDSCVMECSVCLSNLEDEETARMLPNCKHVFHVGCIDTWLASHSTCPICRTAVRPLIQPEPREGPVQIPPAAADDAPPTAPPLAVEPIVEGTSDGGGAKINASNSRLNSFRRILSRERSSRRIQLDSSTQDHNIDRDLERQ